MLGHESCNLIKYLEGFKGVAPIKRGHNPATWMLEVTGGATSTGVKASQIDFPAVYKVTHSLTFCLLSAAVATGVEEVGLQPKVC